MKDFGGTSEEGGVRTKARLGNGGLLDENEMIFPPSLFVLCVFAEGSNPGSLQPLIVSPCLIICEPFRSRL